jgi:hypothetical protein
MRNMPKWVLLRKVHLGQVEAEALGPPTHLMRKAFSLTYVTYEAGDPLGFIMAGVTLAPMYVARGRERRLLLSAGV